MFKSPMKTLLLSAVAGIALMVLPYQQAQATNGYFQSGYGSTSKGMVGAGVAFSQDALAGATNPAGMLDVGNRLDIGVSLFNPVRALIGLSPGAIPLGNTGGNQEPIFLIPDIGVNWMIDKKSSIGLNFYGNGGMNTDYNAAIYNAFPGGSTSPTGVDLSQAFIGVTYAREIAPGHTVGIMPIAVIQKFKAFGLEPFRGISIHPNHVTGNGFDHSFGGGVRVGYQGKVTDSLTLGASYQSRMWMSELSKYRGLFAEE